MRTTFRLPYGEIYHFNSSTCRYLYGISHFTTQFHICLCSQKIVSYLLSLTSRCVEGREIKLIYNLFKPNTGNCTPSTVYKYKLYLRIRNSIANTISFNATQINQKSWCLTTGNWIQTQTSSYRNHTSQISWLDICNCNKQPRYEYMEIKHTLPHQRPGTSLGRTSVSN